MRIELLSGLLALIGTLIGGGITLFSQWWINKQQNKKDYIKLASELAIQQHKTTLEHVNKFGGRVPPVESFIIYYLKYFELMRGNSVSLNKLKDLEDFKKNLDKHYS